MDPIPDPAGEAGFARHPDTLPRSDLTHSVLQASSWAGCGSEARLSPSACSSPVSTSHQCFVDTEGFNGAREAQDPRLTRTLACTPSFVSPGDSHPTNKHPTRPRFIEMLRVWNWSHMGLGDSLEQGIWAGSWLQGERRLLYWRIPRLLHRAVVSPGGRSHGSELKGKQVSGSQIQGLTIAQGCTVRTKNRDGL